MAVAVNATVEDAAMAAAVREEPIDLPVTQSFFPFTGALPVKVPLHVFPETVHEPMAQVVPVTAAVEVSTIFPPVFENEKEDEHVTTGSCAMEFPPMVLGL